MSSCWNSSRNDGTAMATRISTGIRVQATSIRVLWVVLEGIGLALALNFTTTMISSTSTNSVMMVMIQTRRVWNQVMLSITVGGRFLQGPFPRRGLAQFGNAAPPAASATPATAKPSNRRPIWPFDIFMPLALPCEFPKLNPQSIPPDGGKCCTIRPQTNGLGKYSLEYRGQKARTRRNPASQTIILRLSQCSSRAWRGASPAIRACHIFP